MTTLLDEIEGNRTRQAIALAMFILALLALACVKVRNELLMTKAYDRQAVALERIANGMRDYGLYLDDENLSAVKRWEKENRNVRASANAEKGEACK